MCVGRRFAAQASVCVSLSLSSTRALPHTPDKHTHTLAHLPATRLRTAAAPRAGARRAAASRACAIDRTHTGRRQLYSARSRRVTSCTRVLGRRRGCVWRRRRGVRGAKKLRAHRRLVTSSRKARLRARRADTNRRLCDRPRSFLLLRSSHRALAGCTPKPGIAEALFRTRRLRALAPPARRHRSRPRRCQEPW